MADQGEKYSKRGARTSYISTIVGISLVLYILGIVGCSILSINTLKKNVKESIMIDVYFNNNAKEVEMLQLTKSLNFDNAIKEATFVTKEQALKSMNIEEEDLIGSNPFPNSIEIYFHEDYAVLDSVKKIERSLMADNERLIKEVSYNPNQFKDINENLDIVVYVGLGIAALVLLISIALINNTIRLSLYSKRFIIRTMQLVGAKSNFIRRPFLAKAIAQGVIAAIIGLALTIGSLFALIEFFSNDLRNLVDKFSFIILFICITLFGILISWVSTYFALRKYIRLNPDKLY